MKSLLILLHDVSLHSSKGVNNNDLLYSMVGNLYEVSFYSIEEGLNEVSSRSTVQMKSFRFQYIV